MNHTIGARGAVPDLSIDGRADHTCPSPSRCPYCVSDAPVHWIRWGRYARYAGDLDDPSRKVAVPRYRCQLTRRTFSLLPDELLPYCSLKTPVVLSLLHALIIEQIALGPLSRRASIPRGTLRRLKARYVRTAPILRLPAHEGALAGGAFLQALFGDSPGEPAPAVIHLFRSWKEREPKHSIVGIYAR